MLDEPTSFLDIRYKLELLSMLKQLVREKLLAVVMSLHEIDLAQRYPITSFVSAQRGRPLRYAGRDFLRRLYCRIVWNHLRFL